MKLSGTIEETSKREREMKLMPESSAVSRING